jgi:hypothetical protein
MRAYLITSGAIFGLVVLLHAARVAFEGLHVLRDPYFVISSLAATGLCLWACRLLWRRA